MVKKTLNNKKSTKKVEKKNKISEKENIFVENTDTVDSIKQNEEKNDKKRKKNNNFLSKAMNFFHF